MNQEITVEELQLSDKSKMIDFFVQVYKDKSVGTKFVEAYYDMFKGIEHRLFIHGIRKDNKLVCLSISCDTLGELPFLNILKSFFRLFPISSVFMWLCGAISEFFTQEEKKHPLSKEIHYTAHYFEIALIQTLSPYQNQGLEYMMLHYLCEKAKREGFKGVFLVTDRENPLFGACLDKGFKEIPQEEMYLRKGFLEKVTEKISRGEDEQYGTSWCGMMLVF